MKRFFVKGLAALISTALIGAGAALAANGPSALDADTVEYDTRSGQVVATGNVRLTQDNAVITGNQATYNSNTREAVVEGNVVADRDDMHLTAARVTTTGEDYIAASGSVDMTKGDRRFSGEKVDYYPNRDGGYVLIEQGGKITSSEGTFTAAHIEGWLANSHYVGTGSAHVVYPARDMEGGGDRVDYFGGANERKRVVLTGNAWVVQNNNIARGKVMTVYLADTSVETTQQ